MAETKWVIWGYFTLLIRRLIFNSTYNWFFGGSHLVFQQSLVDSTQLLQDPLVADRVTQPPPSASEIAVQPAPRCTHPVVYPAPHMEVNILASLMSFEHNTNVNIYICIYIYE